MALDREFKIIITLLKHILINQNRNHYNQQSYLVAQTVKSLPAMFRFEPWVGKIPWRREWQPTPVFLPGKIPWMEEPGGPQSMGSQRVGHDWVTKTLIQSTHFLTMRNKFVYSDSVKAMLQDWTNSWKAFSASCWLWKCFLHKKLLRCLKKW